MLGLKTQPQQHEEKRGHYKTKTLDDHKLNKHPVYIDSVNNEPAWCHALLTTQLEPAAGSLGKTQRGKKKHAAKELMSDPHFAQYSLSKWAGMSLNGRALVYFA